ncbi:hypothetical protein [Gymnodinialimonas hymeniacidonis]|uniref:hypothetical protein n=1 Tax=Gymnodinialimonas hymeniacidonis TaxID=3126508 RepID=UPI0034C6101F
MKSFITAASIATALSVLSACVVVAPNGTGTTPTGAAVPAAENWGVSLRGRALQRPGEFVNFFSDGTFRWDGGPYGTALGTWTGGPNRLCLNVQLANRLESLCGTAYLTNGQLEFLSDGGGAPIYWNIV